MHNIYNKLNSHEYLDYIDFENFISNYSISKINVTFMNIKENFALYDNLTKTIFIDGNYKNKELKFITSYSKRKLEFPKEKESNFIVDVYNLDTLTTLLHELRHAKQFKKIKKLNDYRSPKLKLIVENYNFMSRMPNLYEKNHDLYYFEYDATINSLMETLNIISKCENLNKNSIIEYNKIMTSILYHSYGNEYSNDDVSKIYNKFSSPISYSFFLANILKNKKISEDIKVSIKALISKSQTEYLKLLNGCKLSNETMKLLHDVSAGVHETVNILDDIKEINKNNEKHTFVKKY